MTRVALVVTVLAIGVALGLVRASLRGAKSGDAQVSLRTDATNLVVTVIGPNAQQRTMTFPSNASPHFASVVAFVQSTGATTCRVHADSAVRYADLVTLASALSAAGLSLKVE